MLSTTQHDGFGGQKKATADFVQARKDIDSLYAYHRQAVRLALREDHTIWDTLQLKGLRVVLDIIQKLAIMQQRIPMSKSFKV